MAVDKGGRVAMVFCVEPGWLEPQARLLAASIRRFGGRLAASEIHAVQPRGDEPLGEETVATFAALGIKLWAGPLNLGHADVPTANKAYAAAKVAVASDAEFLAFLDTDTVILNAPEAFLLAPDADLGVQPTVRKFRGSQGGRDANDPFWLALFAAGGVALPPYVRTVADQVRIRGYYNAGLVVIRREAGLASRWLESLQAIDRLVIEGRENLDQFALALVAAGAVGRVRLLPWHYNYPINRRSELITPMRHADLKDLVHVHYHQAFSIPDFLSRARPALDPTDERAVWLAERLPLEPVVKKPWRPQQKLLRRFAARLRLAADRKESGPLPPQPLPQRGASG